MNDPISRDELLNTIEAMLLAQLRAIRALHGRKPTRTLLEPRQKRLSNMALIENILRDAGEPLHINEIIARAAKQYERRLKRESIVSAITKKVLDQQTFRRSGPNRFALLAPEERQS